MGYSGGEFDPDKVDIYLQDGDDRYLLVKNGMAVNYSEEKATELLSKKLMTFRINCKPGFTGYFEVPAGKDCAVKLMGGGMEIRNTAGEVVARMKGDDYYGIGLLTFRATGDANEVFSFTCLNGNATFKFFAPLPGIWAEKPEWLPRLK